MIGFWWLLGGAGGAAAGGAAAGAGAAGAGGAAAAGGSAWGQFKKALLTPSANPGGGDSVTAGGDMSLARAQAPPGPPQHRVRMPRYDAASAGDLQSQMAAVPTHAPTQMAAPHLARQAESQPMQQRMGPTAMDSLYSQGNAASAPMDGVDAQIQDQRDKAERDYYAEQARFRGRY